MTPVPPPGAASFNLVEEPWIPILDLDGGEREVSLREALRDAHLIRDISGELPTMRFALIRILLAVTYRVLDRALVEDPTDVWADLWERPTLPSDDFERYFDEWDDRFDLLDAERPFLQTPTLRTAKDEWKPISLIVADVEPERPLFTMRSELASLSLAEAARWLVHAHAYDYSGIKSGAVDDDRVKGGKGYPMGIGWAGWLGGIVLGGRNLRETLLLNLIKNQSAAVRGDAPIWERDVPGPGARTPDEIGPIGPTSLMTWQQRRIRLRVEDGRATGVLVTNGDEVPYTTMSGIEPMSGWRFSEPQSAKAKSPRYMPRKLDSGRSLWQGLATLLPNPSGSDSPGIAKTKKKWNVGSVSDPAATIAWVGKLVKDNLVDRGLIIEVSAVSMEYGTQNASYADLVSDRLSFAAALTDIADTEGLLTLAQHAVQRAEQAVRALTRLAGDIDRASGGAGEGPALEAESDAFAALDQHFRAWLSSVAPSCDVSERLATWTELVRRLVEDRGERIAESAPNSAWVGRPSGINGMVVNVGSALRSFDYALFQSLGARPTSTTPADIEQRPIAETEAPQ